MDNIRNLISDWRDEAKEEERLLNCTYVGITEASEIKGRAFAYRQCANELEEILKDLVVKESASHVGLCPR